MAETELFLKGLIRTDYAFLAIDYFIGKLIHLGVIVFALSVMINKLIAIVFTE